ncbi:MAG: dimethyl sulfoxide reductase anchor subunit, partial [Deltaproteobacteria bacterium]|nr:dimethyl sulfoxide reductase anchor subunit [Deltaproteobacteria bacterium]
QSAIGLVWVSVIRRWFSAGTQADLTIGPMFTALILTGLGLCAALLHLARPRLAPYALRNLAVSWLSREVMLVQAFAGAVALSILLILLNTPLWLALLEAAACLLGAAALFAMTRVYLLKTVPLWNSPATPLEFAGSAMLLGGAAGAFIAIIDAPLKPGWNPTLIAAGIGVLFGLILKLAAISPALAAEQSSRTQTWYETTDEPFSAGWALVIRVGLNISGLLLMLAATSWSGSTWPWFSLSLICIGSAEVLGRRRFYLAYRRLGL